MPDSVFGAVVELVAREDRNLDGQVFAGFDRSTSTAITGAGVPLQHHPAKEDAAVPERVNSHAEPSIGGVYDHHAVEVLVLPKLPGVPISTRSSGPFAHREEDVPVLAKRTLHVVDGPVAASSVRCCRFNG